MTMKKIIFCVLAGWMAFGGYSCSSSGRQTGTAEVQDRDSVRVTKEFPFPEIPPLYTTQEGKANYLFAHLWDNFDFADTTLTGDRELCERGFLNQLNLYLQVPIEKASAEAGIRALCEKMEPHEQARRVFMDMIDTYLYDANSPYYNEELYLVYLRRMLESRMLDDARKSTLAFRLHLVERNMPGTRATDFVYFSPDGRRHTLLQTAVKGERLLLFFYDADCPNCRRTLARMKQDDQLSQAVADGRLTVLAIYAEEDQERWKSTLSSLPEGWLVGSDRYVVQEQALYDLKALPSLYLLDAAKNVLVKDRPYVLIAASLFDSIGNPIQLTIDN